MKQKLSISVTQVLALLVFLVLAYFAFFYQLDKHSFRMWDEAIYAVNAYEMSINSDYICRYYDGKPLMWNPKPTLFTAVQALCFKWFGYSEFVFRMPTAILCFSLTLLMIWIGSRKLKKPILGYLAAFILISSGGFIHFHVARTGDMDGPLTFFIFLFSITYYKYLDTEERWMKEGLFLLFMVLLTIAFMIKSFAALIILPGLFIWTIYRKQLKNVLSSPVTYVSIVFFLATIIGYYYLHEIRTPGFLNSVMEKEAGRFVNIVQHKGPFYIYVQHMTVNGKFFPWLILAVISIFLLRNEKDKELKQFLQYSNLLGFVFLIIISSAKTKLVWYMAPIYPFLSFGAAYSLFVAYSYLRNRLNIPNGIQSKAFAAVFFVAVFGYAYYNTVSSFLNRGDANGEKYAYFMEKLALEHEDFNRYILAHSIFNPHIDYYRLVFNEQKQYEIYRKSKEQYTSGDEVLSCDPSMIKFIRQHYDVEEKDDYNECYRFLVLGKK